MANSDTSKLLIDEEPFQLLKSLGRIFGVDEGIFLQQVHYWLRKSKIDFNGKKWVYNSYADWVDQFQVYSLKTMRRIITSLIKKGVLISRTEMKNRINYKFYSIDYNKLSELQDALPAYKGKGYGHYDHTPTDYPWSERPQPLVNMTTSSITENTREKERQISEAKNASDNLPLKTEKQQFAKDSVPYRAANYLVQQIKKLDPGFREPNYQKWAEHVDAMIRLDKRDPHEIGRVIDWATSDSFWKKNILSTQKLRKQYTKLLIGMNTQREPEKSKNEVHYPALPAAGER